MKKTLFVTALFAALSGVAHADTSVTLYGLIDTGAVSYTHLTLPTSDLV